MLVRQLEPEVMDDPQESRAYDNMDHAAVNQKFVDDLMASQLIDSSPTGSGADQHAAAADTVILDLGTGTAQIPIELCKRYGRCQILACDAAVSMLEIARLNVAVASLEHRIELQKCDAKRLDYKDELFDGVMSNSLMHHLPEPMLALGEMLRALKPGGWLFIRDLMRPTSLEQVEQIVSSYAGDESAECQQLLRQSLLAALMVEEVEDMLAALGLPVECVQATSDRHWTLCMRKFSPAI